MPSAKKTGEGGYHNWLGQNDGKSENAASRGEGTSPDISCKMFKYEIGENRDKKYDYHRQANWFVSIH